MYKVHNKERYKSILLKKDMPESIQVSVVSGTWFDKHKSEFMEYSKTVGIFKAVKGNKYLIIYENHL